LRFLTLAIGGAGTSFAFGGAVAGLLGLAFRAVAVTTFRAARVCAVVSTATAFPLAVPRRAGAGAAQRGAFASAAGTARRRTAVLAEASNVPAAQRGIHASAVAHVPATAAGVSITLRLLAAAIAGLRAASPRTVSSSTITGVGAGAACGATAAVPKQGAP
jgi:hypothetical protein